MPARAVAGGTMLKTGVPAKLMLSNRQTVAFAVAPGKPPPRGSFGGVYGFEVKREGSYRVALSGKAWIDVVRGGFAVESTAHDHGPACSGIAKIVTFALPPGRYTLQLSGANNRQIVAGVLPLR
jgi:hypothetical protein